MASGLGAARAVEAVRSSVALYAIAAMAAVGLLFALAVGSPGFTVLFAVILGVGVVFGTLGVRASRYTSARRL